ncbi:MAG: cation:proton antiporter [Planctomycetes bacterium]|nr:cation:proton antiporter [Planctomycetota bacterium]
MPESIGFLADAAVILGTALAASLAARLLRAPAIVGFLIAGILIGPSGFELVRESDVHAFADFGLVLLLFTVGLELSPAPLIHAGPRLVVATAIQMGASTAAIAAGLHLFMDVPLLAASLLGLAAAPASTAIVLKQLSDRGESESAAGGVSTGILLLQDVAAVLAMILLPVLGGIGEKSAALGRAAMALGGLVAATVAARFLLTWLVRAVVRDAGRETMTLFAVVAASGGAWAAGAAGWSPALGAAIVGLLLASTDLRHQLFAEILPLREVFNALFFISIGMLVDLHFVQSHALVVALAIVAAMIGKALFGAAGVRTVGWPGRVAIIVGIGLSTISEFGYIIGKQAADVNLVPAELLDLFVSCAVGSMIFGAMLVPLGAPLALALTRSPSAARFADAHEGGAASLSGHVIVVGYGLNGHNLVSVLRATGIRHVVVEMNPKLAAEARAAGATVLIGDAARQTILEHAGLARARAVAILINDLQATRRIIAQIRARRSDLHLLVRTRFVHELDELYKLGASQVIPEEFETSIEIFAHLLREFSVPSNVIEQQIALVRVGRYGMLRGRPTDRMARQEWARLLETAVTQTYLLDESSPFVGRAIRDTELRARTGVTIIAVTRGGKPIGTPGPEFVLDVGDVLVLVGGHQQLDAARKLLAAQRAVVG